MVGHPSRHLTSLRPESSANEDSVTEETERQGVSNATASFLVSTGFNTLVVLHALMLMLGTFLGRICTPEVVLKSVLCLTYDGSYISSTFSVLSSDSRGFPLNLFLAGLRVGVVASRMYGKPVLVLGARVFVVVKIGECLGLVEERRLPAAVFSLESSKVLVPSRS